MVSILQLKDTGWQTVFLKIIIRPNGLQPARNALHWQRQTYPKSERMEKDIPNK
jgi:hypothetical protein